MKIIIKNSTITIQEVANPQFSASSILRTSGELMQNALKNRSDTVQNLHDMIVQDMTDSIAKTQPEA